MTKFRALLMMCAISGFVGAGAINADAAQPKTSGAAQSAAPLTTDELVKLYHGRSWLWKDGAGYFSAKQRRFTAWSRESGSPSYADGRWFVTNPGKLCFKAKWHAREGAASALTCFSHRKKGRVVFQKREPDGEWYVFKTTPARTRDEYGKIRPGNYVSARLKRIEARLSSGK
jgi:hypothetical protein